MGSEKKRSTRMPLQRLAIYALIFAILWSIFFWSRDHYGQWLKVAMETVVATTITTIIFSIGRRVYLHQRRRKHLRKKGVHMLFRK